VWCVTLPLALVGTEVAHAIAYRLAYPEAAIRFRVLAQTGHGYFELMPVGLGLLAAVLVIGFVTDVVAVARGRRGCSVPAWAFMLIPPLAYAIQECTERWMFGSDAPWLVVFQPSFHYGMLLQIPVALVTLLVAWLLLRVSASLGTALLERFQMRMRRVRRSLQRILDEARLPHACLGTLGRSTRGPPVTV
jgi:hypothetical protein